MHGFVDAAVRFYQFVHRLLQLGRVVGRQTGGFTKFWKRVENVADAVHGIMGLFGIVLGKRLLDLLVILFQCGNPFGQRVQFGVGVIVCVSLTVFRCVLGVAVVMPIFRIAVIMVVGGGFAVRRGDRLGV